MTDKERSQQNAKQVIVVRKDLEMPTWKFGAMCSHASLGALFKCGIKLEDMLHIELKTGTAVEQWITALKGDALRSVGKFNIWSWQTPKIFEDRFEAILELGVDLFKGKFIRRLPYTQDKHMLLSMKYIPEKMI